MKWNPHVRRREEGYVLRMADAPIPGNGRRGKQKTRWKDSYGRNMESAELNVDDVTDETDTTGQSGREKSKHYLFWRPHIMGTPRKEARLPVDLR